MVRPEALLDLHVDEVVLEVPGTPMGLDAEELVRRALELFVQRLPASARARDMRLERLILDGLSWEALQGTRGVEVLADALYARVMEDWR
jgi:hypothetical protein